MSFNRNFGSKEFIDLPDQVVDYGSSPTFDKVYCDTPIVERYEDVYISPFSTNIGPGVSPPTIVKVKDDGAGSTGVFRYAFSDTKEQELFFSIQLPSSWKEGTDIKPHVHFGTPGTSATTITWGLEYVWTNSGDTAGNTTIISNSVATPTAFKVEICEIGSISGVGKKIYSVLNGRLFRAAGGYADVAYLLSMSFHIQIDTLGSATETAK